MRKPGQSRQLLLALTMLTVFLALESSASAWPVNRFYRTGSTNTVAHALRDYECTGRLFPLVPVVQRTHRQPVNRFHRSSHTQSAPQSTPRSRFILFELFR